jgi:hypothetical protein
MNIDKIFNDLIKEIKSLNSANSNLDYNMKRIEKVVDELEKSLKVQKDIKEEIVNLIDARKQLEIVSTTIESNIAKAIISNKEIKEEIEKFRNGLDQFYKDFINQSKIDIDEYLKEKLEDIGKGN